MPQRHTSEEKQVQAYNRMMERIHDLRAGAARHGAPISLQYALAQAKETAVKLGELTQQEADLIARYLRQDLEDAGHYLAHTGRELRDWLYVDAKLIEVKLLEMFAQAADQTRLELMQLQERARHAAERHAGEITGIGTLHCAACGQLLHFHTTGHIPPCPKCRGTIFTRAPSTRPT
jgi:predicted RNA-binding Zn-ribbon protein involved in translation (DUF1610 family)